MFAVTRSPRESGSRKTLGETQGRVVSNSHAQRAYAEANNDPVLSHIGSPTKDSARDRRGGKRAGIFLLRIRFSQRAAAAVQTPLK
jgi:hypothetical protein